MSEVGAREILERPSGEDPRNALLETSNRDVASAMNVGLEAARGESFARINGQGLVPPDFLRQSVRCLQEHL